jgi:tetratricopeptide (TPR) repeat protein
LKSLKSRAPGLRHARSGVDTLVCVGLRHARSGACAFLCVALLVAGCASSPRLLWEEYTSAGLQAYGAGQYGRAEMYLNRAARKAEDLGPQELGRSLNNLAELARRQGRAAEAERLFARALAVKEMGLGPDHPDVATSLNNLAQIYVAQGRDAAAAPLLERSLGIQEKALDPEHPVLRRTLTLLAEVYRHLGRAEEAFILDVRARMLREEPAPER